MTVKVRRTPLDEVDDVLRRLARNRADALDRSDLAAYDAISGQIDYLLEHRQRMTDALVS